MTARTAGLVAGLVLVLAGFQYLVLETPVDLVPRDGAAEEDDPDARYRISGVSFEGTERLEVELFGVGPVDRGDIALVRAAPGASADPVRAAPRFPDPSGTPDYATVVIPEVRRGEYKLTLPGFRPFGLVPVR